MNKQGLKMMNKQGLKIDVKQVFLLIEEIDEFPDIYHSLEKVITTINPNLVLKKIPIKDICISTKNVLTILPRDFKKQLNIKHILIITDIDYVWSKIRFFEDYFKNEEQYKFSINSFRKTIFDRGGFKKMNSKNKLLSFLPFLIIRSNFGFMPKFVLKDASFYGEFQSMKYCHSYFLRPKLFNDKFTRVVEMLGDDRSKDIYTITINGKAEDNWRKYFDTAHKNLQYSDYVQISEQDIIINCGIEDGFEIQLFSLENPKIIYNVDPCGNDKLSPVVEKFIKNTGVNNVFIKKALYMTDGVPKEFKSFETTTLLEIIDDYDIDRIDLIKSDIEGAERNMVADLIEIAEKFRPQLAISIYHSNGLEGKFILDDYVDIPLKIMESLTDYKFYVHHYCYERWELILYCIPNEMIEY